MKNIDALIQKANRIGAFFEAQPQREQAIEGVVDHLRKFWEPRMRLALLDFLAGNPQAQTESGTQLSPFVLDIVQSHSDRLRPAIMQD